MIYVRDSWRERTRIYKLISGNNVGIKAAGFDAADG